MHDYPETWVTYQGHTFAAPDYRDVPAQYLLVTDDAAVAAALGFAAAAPGEGYGFERWVDAAGVERVVRRFAYGIYRGVQVAVLSEGASGCIVESDRRLPGLEQLEPTVYRGKLPPGALERVWTDDQG